MRNRKMIGAGGAIDDEKSPQAGINVIPMKLYQREMTAAQQRAADSAQPNASTSNRFTTAIARVPGVQRDSGRAGLQLHLAIQWVCSSFGR
jgi:hypothetical protein